MSSAKNKPGSSPAVQPRKSISVRQTGRPHVMVIADGDKSLVALTEQAGASSWIVEPCRDAVKARDRLSEGTPELILIDDDAVQADDRGWLLERIRQQAPRTFVIYVAAHHDGETEKRARAHGVHYYMSKPIDPNRFILVSQSFIKAASRT